MDVSALDDSQATPIYNRSRLDSMKRFLNKLFPTLVSSHSAIVERGGLTYHQDTNQLVTGVIEYFHEDGQLQVRGNYIDGKREGVHERFNGNGQLEDSYRDGELIE